MEHGVSWLLFLPFYEDLQNALLSMGEHGWIFSKPVVVQHVLAAILVTIIVLIVGIKARLDLNKRGDDAVIPTPDITLLNFLEVTFEWVYGQMRDMIGKEASRYFPVIAALTLFIFFSNILGLVPGFLPPTDNWNTTFACSIFVFLYFNFHGMRTQGFGHIAHMANPTGEWWGWFLSPLLFPIELVSNLARPFSLGVRLASNMIGDHAVLAAFLGLVPILVPIPFLILGLFVSVVQTLVFILLSTIYIALSVNDPHGDEHHDTHHETPQGAEVAAAH
ncbi:F0F1 ATP synthase subunit A [Myxococcota bacterium]|nr:F0F1 ATP synthase subunit A [Myxococcota bacterium]